MQTGIRLISNFIKICLNNLKATVFSTMRCLYFTLLCLFCFTVLLQDCNDPALLGGDLLKEDEINLKFVDTFKLEAQTVLDTNSVTRDNALGIVPYYMPLGNFNDPVFGTTDARIYTQFARFTNSFGFPPSFTGATLDSVMLYLALDTIDASYGNTSNLSNFEAYQMTEPIDASLRYKSGQYSFGSLANPIGSLDNLIISTAVRPRIVTPTDTVTFDPHIAFKLSNTYGNYLLHLDSLVYNSDSIFRANVFGLMFKQSNLNSLIFPFNLSSPFSKLQVLFTTAAGVHTEHTFPFYIGIPTWTHDYNMTIRDALRSEAKGKELIYLQSLGGLKAKVRFPNLTLPPGAIINKAELEVTAITLPNDIPATYTLPAQLALFKLDTSGSSPTYGLDIPTSDQGGSSFTDFSLLGGTPVEKVVNGATVKVYTLNISNHIQKIIAGKEASEVYLAIAPNSIDFTLPVNKNLSRVVLGGPKHPMYPMKLKISFTTF
jgi:hypothetical protein